MLTLILILVPLLASIIVLAAGKKNAAVLSLGFSFMQFLLTIWIWINFKAGNGTQFVLDLWWIESLGISFKIGMDGISFLLVALTNILTLLIVLASYNKQYSSAGIFYGLILFMQSALVGVFVALDGFLFYVFWELALIPIYFICLGWGGENRSRITLKFFIYTLAGSLFMLLGFIYLYLQTPLPHSFDIEALYNLRLSPIEQSFIFFTFFFAFAVKIPIFPLHTWQPDTYTVAPAAGTMLLSGIMLKMGLYGVMRWMLPIVPMGMAEWAWLAILLSVIGVIYASCIALMQSDFKRLIAFSSIAHVGLIAAGIFIVNTQGLQGAVMQMFSHGFNVLGLFLIADILYRQTGTMKLKDLGGLAHESRTFAVLFMIILLGSIALPLTNGFIGEFLLLVGIYQYDSWLAFAAGFTIILGAVYMLRSYKMIMLGDQKLNEGIRIKLQVPELIVLLLISAVVLGTGIFPQIILNVSEPDIAKLIETFRTRTEAGF